MCGRLGGPDSSLAAPKGSERGSTPRSLDVNPEWDPPRTIDSIAHAGRRNGGPSGPSCRAPAVKANERVETQVRDQVGTPPLPAVHCCARGNGNGFGVLAPATHAGAALTVQDLDNGASADGLAQELAGQGVSISNVVYTGSNSRRRALRRWRRDHRLQQRDHPQQWKVPDRGDLQRLFQRRRGAQRLSRGRWKWLWVGRGFEHHRIRASRRSRTDGGVGLRDL